MSENPYYYHNNGTDGLVKAQGQQQQQQQRYVAQPVVQLVVPQNELKAIQHQKLPYHSHRRQGHLCFGGCCDMRIAVIIVNSINLFLMIMALVSVLIIRHYDKVAITTLSNQTSNYIDDDTYMELLDDSISILNKSLFPFTIIIILVCIRLCSSTIGILGAILYNTCFLQLTAIMYCIDIVIGLLLLNPFDIITYSLFAYPHFVLVREIHTGVMSPDTYKYEQFCCCCV